MKNKQTLKLFNAVQVVSKQGTIIDEITKRTIKNGYILDKNIYPDESILSEIEEVIGLSGEKANATFHKSWKTIIETDKETLILQQIMHYMTTYGFEELGIYNDKLIYIPNEVLELPEIKDNLPLVYIRGLTKEEILEEIIKLAGSGIALHKDTLNDIIDIIEYNKYNSDFIEKIKNRELLAKLKDFYNIVPTEPVEYLRYVISKLTNESLLIKNNDLIEKIKSSNGKFLDTLLVESPKDLASIFFRYKPLFLAMKKISKNKTFFNRLRKQADKLHKPLPEDYLNSVTNIIKYEDLDIKKLNNELRTASIFRKIRLLYALHFRMLDCKSIVYQIRNGKAFIKDFNYPTKYLSILEDAYNSVHDSIVIDISKNVKGVNIFIPEYMHYALPATEKQFIGNIPNGSYVELQDNIITGVHWYNTNRTIDLDLSTIGLSGKTGWDSDYISDDNCIFSGDITSAPKPNGATEAFYIPSGKTETKLLVLNYYNYNENSPVHYKFFVAKEKTKNFGKNYMVDISNILCSANLTLDRYENILGVIANNKVIFSNMSIGKRITSSENKNVRKAREFLEAKLLNPISFNDILKQAGANIIEEPIDTPYIDLSPEKLDKNSFINLLI